MKYLIFILLLLPFVSNGQKLSEDLSQLEKERETASKLARKHQVDGVHDKAVYYGLKALDLARETQNQELLFSELLKVSSIESDAGFYDRSIKRLLEAEELDTSSYTQKRLSWSYARLFIGMDAPRLALDKLLKFPNHHTSSVAKLYTELGIHDSAVYHYRKIMENGPKSIHNYNNLGIAFAANNKIDSGLYYYHKALEYAKPDDFMYGMINGNIGSLYSKNNLYKKAAPYLKIDFEISEKVKEYEIHINVGELLYRAYKNTGEDKAATAVMQNMLTYKNRVNLESELNIARVELLHFKGRENALEYNQRLKSYEALSNKRFKSIQDKVQATAEALSGYRIKQIETEKTVLNQKLIIEQNEKKRNQLKNGLIILGLALGTLIILFFFWRFRTIQKRNALIKEAELDSAQKEQEILALKVKEENRNVQELSLELITKKDFSETVLKKLREFENVSKSDLMNIEMFIQNELELKSTRSELLSQMGDLSNNFHNELKIHHSNLSENEVKLAAMIVMKMTNKEIAISKNITPASVRITKVRLKKKLAIPTETDLTDYLAQLL